MSHPAVRASRPASSPARRRAAFTLVEILIVVIVLGVLASIVVPRFASAATDSETAVVAKNLRQFATQFVLFHARTGAYPADESPGVMPAPMVGLIDPATWSQGRPAGGQWDWDHGQFGVTAGVSVFQPQYTAAQMTEVDRLLDDGDPATGRFRARANGYIYVVQP